LTLLPLLQAAPRPVTFESRGITLAGEISYPPGDGPFPAVALVHGSGPATREGNAPLVALFRDLGFTVLAYDKRGTGKSGGEYRGVGVRNSDSMIPLLGAPIRFFVALSGPAVSVGEETYFSRYFEHTDRPLVQADSVMDLFTGAPGYDPHDDLRQGDAVGLYILGGLDRSVPTSRSVARLQRLDSSSARFTVVLLPTGDHALFDAYTGAPLPFGVELAAWLRRIGADTRVRGATTR